MNNMTSRGFEIAAKNAVVSAIKQNYDENYRTVDIDLVWFAHVLGNKKAILIDHGPNLRMYEVTYDRDQDRLYVDTYEKKHNATVYSYDMTEAVCV